MCITGNLARLCGEGSYLTKTYDEMVNPHLYKEDKAPEHEKTGDEIADEVLSKLLFRGDK